MMDWQSFFLGCFIGALLIAIFAYYRIARAMRLVMKLRQREEHLREEQEPGEEWKG